MIALLCAVAAADMLPPDSRVLQYQLIIDNIDAYPDHVLLLYPTSNHGYAYVFEADKGLTGVMSRSGRRGGPTSLYAIPRTEFDQRNPEPSQHDHGDSGELVTVVPRPWEADPRAELDIAPPGLVNIDDPRLGLTRTVHIESITDDAFVLSLVSEDYTTRDEPGSLPPTRCATTAAAGGLVSLSLAILGLTRRRDQS